jgi:transposase
MGRSSPRSRSFVPRALHLDRGSGPTPPQAAGGGHKHEPGLTGGPSTDKGPADRTEPTDRGKAGSKYPLLVDAHGLPLNVLVSAANRHDSMLVEPLLDSMPAIRRGGRGHPRRRPGKLHGDKGYDNPRVRRYLPRRGITARIARIGVDSSARLGRHRWVVERTLGWLLSYKRLALRYDRTTVTITALARLDVTLICARRLPSD